MTAGTTDRPLVAILGSVDPDRAYQPALKAPAAARAACRELGRELALAGCDLVVFSSGRQYAEGDAAHGYASATGADLPGLIVAHPPRHQDPSFDFPAQANVTVRIERDTSDEWEVPYYRSVLDADGIILVGGGQSTRVAGIVAMAQQIPVLPVACFGGGASFAWVNLGKVRNYATDEDIRLLGDEWREDSARRIVASLLRQRTDRIAANQARALAERSGLRAEAIGLAVAVVCLVGSLAAIPVVGPPRPAGAGNLALLLAAPILAAVGGALVRNSFAEDRRWFRAAVRGLGAGVATVLLYVASQVLTVPNLLSELDARRLLLFVIPLGFGAGFTFDLVFDRLRRSAGAVSLPSVGTPGERTP